MVHAEGYDAIRYMTERLEREGQTAPYYHAVSRPEIVEREATHRAISHAELVDVPIMIVHVSGREAMEQIRWAQSRGPEGLCRDLPAIHHAHRRGPARSQHGHERRQICLLASAARHGEPGGDLGGAPHRRVPDLLLGPLPIPLRQPGRQAAPEGTTSFRWVPNGIPGVETRLPILFSEGVSKGRISLNRFVELTSTNHAKIYGLYPQKGSIGVGFDADIALWDPNRQETIRQDILHHGADYTPWEGFEVTGWPVTTLLRGQVVAEERTYRRRERKGPNPGSRSICLCVAGGQKLQQ